MRPSQRRTHRAVAAKQPGNAPKTVWRGILTVCAALVCGSCATIEKPTAILPSSACLAPAVWYRFTHATPRPVAELEVLEGAARGEVVLLGEQHDDADHHRWQLQTLAGLHLLRPDMVIGFESFPRRVQPVLDRWIAGELTQAQFLEQSEWKTVWTFPAELYLPLFHFARLNRIPMIALNVERALIASIGRTGWDQVAADDREGLSRAAPASLAYEERLFDAFKLHGTDKTVTPTRDDPAFRRFVEAQITWDRAMAEALAQAVKAPRASNPLAVGIMGAGHVRDGYGVPHQLRDLGVTRIATLLPVDSADTCSNRSGTLADAVFALPGSARDPRPGDR